MRKQLKSILSIALAVIIALSWNFMSFAENAQDTPTRVAGKEKPTEYVEGNKIKAVSASSYQPGYEPGKATDGIEDDSNNCWHTPWEADSPGFPHWIQVEFTEAQTIDSLEYVARSATGFQFVTSYEVWVSPDNKEENLMKVAEGEWSRAKIAEAKFDDVSAVLVRFIAKEKVDSNYEDTYSVSASEIKFGLAPISEAGEFNDEIKDMQAVADRVIEHVSADAGKGEHQFKITLMDKLKQQKKELEQLVDSANEDAVKKALKDTQTAIEEVLSSNKGQEEEFITVVPKNVMHAEANTENSGYEVEKAVDGDRSSIWHSQWEPEPTKRPHILTIDLGQSVLTDSISITPRQDMNNGRITIGKIYAGNDLENMEEVREFIGEEIQEIKMNYWQARYIRIESLEGPDAHTAIAEVDVKIYDRGYTELGNIYNDAANFLSNVQTGDEVGQYPEKAKEKFEKEMKKISDKMKEPHVNSEYYQLSEKVVKEKEKFASQVNRYTLEDLKNFIKEAKDLVEQLEGKDKEKMQDAIEEAEKTAKYPGITKEEIHDAATTLKAAIDGMKIAGEKQFDLSGKWEFKLGSYKEGEELSDTVVLPKTLDENKKGNYNVFRDPRRLSRYYLYTGPAVFQREVFIPNSWEGRQLTLYMERSRETQVWVNGTEVLAPDSSNLLAVSQVYDVTGQIKYGEMNHISIEVDNSYPNSPKDAITTSSIATEETQTNWNGIVGKFELRATELINIDDLRVYPNPDLKSATVEIDVKNGTGERYEGNVTVQADQLGKREIPVSVDAGEIVTTSITDYDMGDNVKLWSEFEQNLYTMSAALENGNQMSEQFGMRVFAVDESTKQLTNNGNKVFLRNESNCAVFPLTAYAPMEEEEWEKLFSAYQSYGINSVRFHSWCPPEAAFKVADRMGMYLQPELSCWDPGSMFGGETETAYFTNEAKAIMKEYANHPSFVMFSFGNELHFAQGGYEYADQLIQELKEEDSTRLYSFASNGDYGSTKPTANSDFFTGQVYNGTTMRGIYAGMSGFINQTRPASVANYNEAVSRAAKESGVPAFSFEVGQFQVFPDVLSEMEGYTGVLEPRNLQLVEERLESMGISDETTAKYINASGMLSKIGYRMEIEAALRTQNMSGISLLGIQDFSGQSTALVGMMNALGNPKPYDFADPQQFSTFFSPEVALLETEKFVWTNKENLTGKVMMANYGPSGLEGSMTWKLADDKEIIAAGKTGTTTFSQGSVTTAGEISVPLSGVKEAKQLKLTIGLDEIENSYDIWVYPAEEQAPEGDVYIAEYLDEEAMYVLEDGGKVLLAPKANKSALPQSITGTFTTAFWSSQFVSESQPGSMGLLMNPEHPVFDGFPTEYHSNFQWWPMAKLGRPMVLEDLTQKDGTKIEPLVQVLDSFSTIRTMGLLYEAKVGEGKLMVSSMGLEQLKGQYPEASALRSSILKYMNSDAFDPKFEVEVEKIQESVIGTESDPRVNLAEKSNGGDILLGENTITCQEGYDNHPQDRKLELNDGRVDVETSSRSWTDWNRNDTYPDAEITAVLNKEYTVDTIMLPFFEDYGCKAPESIKIEYLTDEGFVEVNNPSQTTGFVKGTNTITFDPVNTKEIRITMVHQPGMAVALSEFIVYEKVIPAESIQIVPEDGKTSIKAGGTLQLGIEYKPENANDTDVRWKALDAEGNKSSIAKISLSGILTASEPGTVYVEAALRSNSKVSDKIEITVLPKDFTPPVDKTEFDKALGEAAKYKEEDYTQESWKVFYDVYQQAKSFGELTNATQHDTDVMTEKLLEAMEALVLKTEKIDVTGITLEKEEITLEKGKAFLLKAVIAPENATNKNVTWYSSNPDIAEVDSTGMVTAKAKGETIISVVTKDGGFKAECRVTVTERKPEQPEKPGDGDSEETSKPSKPNKPSLPQTGAMVGGTLMALVGVAALGAGLVVLKRRKK